jgi:hypothetical protein
MVGTRQHYGYETVTYFIILRTLALQCDRYRLAKSFIEVTTCTSSNILVWFGRDASEKGVAGLTESLIFSLFAIAKGLVKYERPNSGKKLGKKP